MTGGGKGTCVKKGTTGNKDKLTEVEKKKKGQREGEGGPPPNKRGGQQTRLREWGKEGQEWSSGEVTSEV